MMCKYRTAEDRRKEPLKPRLRHNPISTGHCVKACNECYVVLEGGYVRGAYGCAATGVDRC